MTYANDPRRDRGVVDDPHACACQFPEGARLRRNRIFSRPRIGLRIRSIGIRRRLGYRNRRLFLPLTGHTAERRTRRLVYGLGEEHFAVAAIAAPQAALA